MARSMGWDTVDIKVEFSRDLAKVMQDASYQLAHEVDKTLYGAGLLIQGEIIKKISRGGSTGARYQKGGKVAFRSAPGQPPKTDTGRLVNSIRVIHDFLSVQVGSDVLYAPFLEFGTRKMDERPYLRPTMDENQDKIEQAIFNTIQRVLGS